MYSNWKMFNHIEWRRLAIWQTKFRDLSSTNKDLHREERFQALLLGYHDNEQTSYNNRLNVNFKKTKFERLFGW